MGDPTGAPTGAPTGDSTNGSTNESTNGSTNGSTNESTNGGGHQREHQREHQRKLQREHQRGHQPKLSKAKQSRGAATGAPTLPQGVFGTGAEGQASRRHEADGGGHRRRGEFKSKYLVACSRSVGARGNRFEFVTSSVGWWCSPPLSGSHRGWLTRLSMPVAT
jgi:hypothetical protein